MQDGGQARQIIRVEVKQAPGPEPVGALNQRRLVFAAKLGAKRHNVFYAGRSGGAEFITYELAAHHQSAAGTGGAVSIAGGGAPDRYPRASAAVRSMPMTWIVGDKDRAGQTNLPAWSAHRASAEGRSYYAKRGFTKTKRVVLKGVNHYGYDNAKLVGKYLGRPR